MTASVKVFFVVDLLLLVALTSVVVYANVVEPFYPTGVANLLTTRYGGVVLGDFSVSLIFTGAWFCAVSKSPSRGLVLGALNMVLGNPVLLTYLAVRAFRAKHLKDIFLPMTGSSLVAAPPS
jgi:hypothetical protein